jgi:hypothetical protein
MRDEELTDDELAEIRQQMSLATVYPSRTSGERLYLDAPVAFAQNVIRLLAEVERQRSELRLLTATHSGENDPLYQGESVLSAGADVTEEHLRVAQRAAIDAGKSARPADGWEQAAALSRRLGILQDDVEQMSEREAALRTFVQSIADAATYVGEWGDSLLNMNGDRLVNQARMLLAGETNETRTE